MSLLKYEKQAEKLYQEVSRLNLHFNNAQNYHLKLSGSAPQEMEILTEREPIGCISSNTVANLFMLRSWSLFEAMKYSDSIIPKIQLTNKPKEDRLKFIVSKLGVPLRESQQKYEYMDSKFKKNLNENIARLIENEILDEIFITEFMRQYDNQNRISSLDMVRMANALLTCPTDFSGLIFYYFNFRN